MPDNKNDVPDRGQLVRAFDHLLGYLIIRQGSASDPESAAAAENAADRFAAARNNGASIRSAIDQARPK
jgi:hypothetical protein